MRFFKTLNYTTLLFCSVFSLSACGGDSERDTVYAPVATTVPAEKPTIVISVITELAIEKSNVFAKFKVERTGHSSVLAIDFDFKSDDSYAHATSEDFTLVYSDGGPVGDTIELADNQNSRVIEVQPVQDNIHEVIESISITLTERDDYQLTNDKTARLQIADADNTSNNSKVFIGYFSPQDEATTVGSGVLSLVLQGDNERATLSYEFTGLSSEQTDQHIHLAPSGTMIKDIEHMGSVYNYTWDLAPGGPFTSKQQMLDSLFSGAFYLNIHTANYPNGEIFASFTYDENIAPPENSLLTSEDRERDIIRFLNQATFGASPSDYEFIKSQMNDDGSNRMQVYEAWIEQQMSLPATSMLELTDATVAQFPGEKGWHARRDAFWPIAVYAKDQLRQRVAFALSEILVIGDGNTVPRRAYRGVADYWDTLSENAFGQYNHLLEQVSRHAIMGNWLSHLKNSKANTEQGTFPDENYAREIMQLFSFGLVHQEINGTVKLGENNLPETTYDNAVIENLARVFTGLSFSKVSDNGVMVDNTKFKLGNKANYDQYRWTEPMMFFTQEHDFGKKILFNDGVRVIEIAAREATLANADSELNEVINAIVAHPTTAPFISYRLIQRFVTSNPSNDYIQRVSTVFGETGDLKQTIKAILLDPEARSPSVIASSSFGKVKEPVLRFTNLMRLLRAHSSIELGKDGIDFVGRSTYLDNASLLRVGDLPINQRSLGSPSVFNFFSPDFSPAGELASQSLVAPELQLMIESTMVNTINTFSDFILNGLVRSSHRFSDYKRSDLIVRLDLQAVTNIWQQTQGSDEDKAMAVLNYLDFYLNAGQLKNNQNGMSYQALINAMGSVSATNDKINIAIYGLTNAPETLVQR